MKRSFDSIDESLPSRPRRNRRRTVLYPPQSPPPPPSPLDTPPRERTLSRPRRASLNSTSYAEDDLAYRVEYSDLDSDNDAQRPEGNGKTGQFGEVPVTEVESIRRGEVQMGKVVGAALEGLNAELLSVTTPGARSPARSVLKKEKEEQIIETRIRGRLHAEPGIEGIKLYDEATAQFVNGKVPPSSLHDVLSSNPTYAIYIGQIHNKLPSDYLSSEFSQSMRNIWRDEMKKPPLERLTLMIGVRRTRILSPKSTPTVTSLPDLLDAEGVLSHKSEEFRVYNAQFTPSTGFTRKRWDTMTVAHKFEEIMGRQMEAQRKFMESRNRAERTDIRRNTGVRGPEIVEGGRNQNSSEINVEKNKMLLDIMGEDTGSSSGSENRETRERDSFLEGSSTSLLISTKKSKVICDFTDDEEPSGASSRVDSPKNRDISDIENVKVKEKKSILAINDEKTRLIRDSMGEEEDNIELSAGGDGLKTVAADKSESEGMREHEEETELAKVREKSKIIRDIMGEEDVKVAPRGRAQPRYSSSLGIMARFNPTRGFPVVESDGDDCDDASVGSLQFLSPSLSSPGSSSQSSGSPHRLSISPDTPRETNRFRLSHGSPGGSSSSSLVFLKRNGQLKLEAVEAVRGSFEHSGDLGHGVEHRGLAGDALKDQRIRATYLDGEIHKHDSVSEMEVRATANTGIAEGQKRSIVVHRELPAKKKRVRSGELITSHEGPRTTTRIGGNHQPSGSPSPCSYAVEHRGISDAFDSRSPRSSQKVSSRRSPSRRLCAASFPSLSVLPPAHRPVEDHQRECMREGDADSPIAPEHTVMDTYSDTNGRKSSLPHVVNHGSSEKQAPFMGTPVLPAATLLLQKFDSGSSRAQSSDSSSYQHQKQLKDAGLGPRADSELSHQNRSRDRSRPLSPLRPLTYGRSSEVLPDAFPNAKSYTVKLKLTHNAAPRPHEPSYQTATVPDGQLLSVFGYIWDYEKSQRSSALKPLDEIISISSRDRSKALYDGQDIEMNALMKQKAGNTRMHTAWVSRRGSTSSRRRVRLWNYVNGRILSFTNSPRLCLLQKWLQMYPNHVLFNPQLLLSAPGTLFPYEHQDGKLTGRDRWKRLARVFRAVIIPLIVSLRNHNLLTLTEEKIKLWNRGSCCFEPARTFPSRIALIRFLLASPHLELKNGQDELLDLERSERLHVVSVSNQAHASLCIFWDVKSKKCVEVDPKEQNCTVREWLELHASLELYIGQDKPSHSSLRKVYWRKPGISTGKLMMIACPEDVQSALFDRGWKLISVHPSNVTNGEIVCWDKNAEELVMQPELGRCLTFEELRRERSTMNLYVGQDLKPDIQANLHQWIDRLRKLEGTSDELLPALTRKQFLGVRKALRIHLEGEAEPEPEDSWRNRRAKKRAADALRSLKIGEEDQPAAKRSTSMVMLRSSASSARSKKAKMKIAKSTSVQPRTDGEQAVASAYFLEKEGIAEDDVHSFGNTSDGMEDASEELETGIETAGVMSLPSPTTSLNGDAEQRSIYISPLAFESAPEDPLANARQLAWRAIGTIRDATPRVLKRELRQDMRQSLREKLILEVESKKALKASLAEFNKLSFLPLALELAESLVSLDTYDCFPRLDEFGGNSAYINFVLEELVDGHTCTIAGITHIFRSVCADLLLQHEGTVLFNEAMEIRKRGEHVITDFKQRHGEVVEVESKFMRMYSICERAKNIGFVPISSRRNGDSSSKSTRLRLRGGKSDVTNLNYRDEKGNSVMGKLHSVRVFGFTIDREKRERNLGYVRACHLCLEKVVFSRGESLRCANHVFDECKELVCKCCLVDVLQMEQEEFLSYRARDNWFCMHCKGLCMASNFCRRSEAGSASDDHTSQAYAEQRMRLQWPWHDGVVEKASVRILRRQRDGTYGDLSTAASYELQVDQTIDRCNLWADLELRHGAYRCEVTVNGTTVAGSTFLVSRWRRRSTASLDKPIVSRSRNGKVTTKVTYRSHLREGNTEETIKARNDPRTIPRGVRVQWSQSVMKNDAVALHAIREDGTLDGGTLIKCCSRTEGYDWRRAKQTATLQWIPKRIAPENEVVPVNKVEMVLLTATDSKQSHLHAMERRPSLRIGWDIRRFISEMQACRYEKMLKQSWGLITGRSTIHGIGLFTMTGYQTGDYVIEYAGDLIRNCLADVREKKYDNAGLGTYFFRLNEREIVDATVNSNRARFTNHSCDPNMAAEIIHVNGRDLVVLKATREIASEAELTFDYQLPYEDKKEVCLCNSWNCVGVMN